LRAWAAERAKPGPVAVAKTDAPAASTSSGVGK